MPRGTGTRRRGRARRGRRGVAGRKASRKTRPRWHGGIGDEERALPNCAPKIACTRNAVSVWLRAPESIDRFARKEESSNSCFVDQATRSAVSTRRDVRANRVTPSEERTNEQASLVPRQSRMLQQYHMGKQGVVEDWIKSSAAVQCLARFLPCQCFRHGTFLLEELTSFLPLHHLSFWTFPFEECLHSNSRKPRSLPPSSVTEF